MGRAVQRRVTTVEAFEEVKPTLTPGAAKAKAIAALTLKAEAEAANSQFGTLKGELLTYMAEADLDEDDKGHRYMRFERPIITGGKQWGGIKREKRTSVSVDLDKSEEFLKEKGLWNVVSVEDTVVHLPRTLLDHLHAEGHISDEYYNTAETTVTFDPDDLYVLNQQDYITDEELDALFVKTTTYAFVPFKAA